MEQLPSEKSLTPGLEPTTIGFDREIATGASDHCATTEKRDGGSYKFKKINLTLILTLG